MKTVATMAMAQPTHVCVRGEELERLTRCTHLEAEHEAALFEALGTNCPRCWKQVMKARLAASVRTTVQLPATDHPFIHLLRYLIVAPLVALPTYVRTAHDELHRAPYGIERMQFETSLVCCWGRPLALHQALERLNARLGTVPPSGAAGRAWYSLKALMEIFKVASLFTATAPLEGDPFKEAAWFFTKGGSAPSVGARLLAQRGQAMFAHGDSKAGTRYFRQALGLLEGDGWQPHRMEVLAVLGGRLARHGERAAAHDSYLEAARQGEAVSGECPLLWLEVLARLTLTEVALAETAEPPWEGLYVSLSAAHANQALPLAETWHATAVQAALADSRFWALAERYETPATLTAEWQRCQALPAGEAAPALFQLWAMARAAHPEAVQPEWNTALHHHAPALKTLLHRFGETLAPFAHTLPRKARDEALLHWQQAMNEVLAWAA